MFCLMDLVAPPEDARCEELLYVMGMIVRLPVATLAMNGSSMTAAV